MRLTLLLLAASPGAAMAHVGHLGEQAGHDHWVAGAAIGIAIGLGAWSAWKGRRGKKAGQGEPDAPEQPEQKAEA